jgi:hypothetical protein
MRLPLLLLFMFMVAPSEAQESYLITSRGDTLHGNLTFIQGDKIDQVQIRGAKKVMINALQIRYAYQNGTPFKPVKYQDKVRMMKVLIDGYISYYAFQPSADNQAYNNFLLVRADGERMEVPRLNFKREMTAFLDDASLNDSINNDLLGRNDLEHILKQFNKNLDQSTVEKMEKRNLYNSTEIKLIEEAIKTLNQMQTTTVGAELQELTEALNDVRSRILERKFIPIYLREAIEKNKLVLKNNDQALSNIENILLSINQ